MLARATDFGDNACVSPWTRRQSPYLRFGAALSLLRLSITYRDTRCIGRPPLPDSLNLHVPLRRIAPPPGNVDCMRMSTLARGPSTRRRLAGLGLDAQKTNVAGNIRAHMLGA